MKPARDSHGRTAIFCAALSLAAAFAMWSRAGARQSAVLPRPASIVKTQTYVSTEPAPRGQTVDAAVAIEIADGFHMNSHKPSEDYLIPTTLTVDPPTGIRVLDETYPAGELKRFSFSKDKPLDVYTGSVTLRLKLAVDEKATLGAMSIPATLRYQACNDNACLPPVKLPVVLRVNVVAAGTSVHHIHPEIFRANPAKPSAAASKKP